MRLLPAPFAAVLATSLTVSCDSPAPLSSSRVHTPRACAAATVASEDDPLLSWLAKQGGHARVASGTDQNGLRGLVATEPVEVGAVLLEVPLTATLVDRGDGTAAESLPGEPPEWSASLPWNVQLALAVLAQRADGTSPWAPFLSSWPSEPPPLPKNMEPAQLAEAQDMRFEADVDGDYFWAAEQYAAVVEAAEAAGLPTPCSDAELRWALELVWSRVLRLSCGATHGVRRLLVPVLDLANHEPQPSALFTYSAAAGGGGAVRLHAVRALEAGDAVTITYGEESGTHFCQYYGFVPSDDPYASWQLSPLTLLAAVPASLLAPPEGGWAAAAASGALDLPRTLELGSCLSLAEPLALLRAAGVGGGDDADEGVAVALEAALGAIIAAHPTSAEEDEAMLNGAELPDAVRPLVQMRLGRKRMLALLRERLRADPHGAAPPLPSQYPALDEVPIEELEAWGSRPFE